MYLGEDDSTTGSQFDSTRQSRLENSLLMSQNVCFRHHQFQSEHSFPSMQEPIEKPLLCVYLLNFCILKQQLLSNLHTEAGLYFD